MYPYGGIFGIIVLILDIWAIVTILNSGQSTNKKVLWIVIIVLLPIIGLILWLLLGKR